jgi:uracil-DNA glycosylase family 4
MMDTPELSSIEWNELNEQIIQCRKCARLVAWREEVARIKRRAFREEEYWGRPVSGFGDPHAKVMIVGLAPGAHGSNRTGRMFTGDDSGHFLYRALYEAGFANQPEASDRHDGLELKRIFISALCRCVPPDNKPLPEEMANCRHFLLQEAGMLRPEGIVALGKLAYDQVLHHLVETKDGVSLPSFSHGVFIPPDVALPWVIGSYHPSRQNTQTGRLTKEMFDQIWKKVNDLLA